MNVNYAKFQKRLIVEQFKGTTLNSNVFLVNRKEINTLALSTVQSQADDEWNRLPLRLMEK